MNYDNRGSRFGTLVLYPGLGTKAYFSFGVVVGLGLTGLNNWKSAVSVL